MKTTTTKKPQASVSELREALEAVYAELIAEFPKVQTSARKFQQAQAGTPAYDQAWADFYVALNVLETKSRTLQMILDKISEHSEDEES